MEYVLMRFYNPKHKIGCGMLTLMTPRGICAAHNLNLNFFSGTKYNRLVKCNGTFVLVESNLHVDKSFFTIDFPRSPYMDLHGTSLSSNLYSRYHHLSAVTAY